SADEKILSGRSPVLLEPFDIRFEAAAGRDERAGAHESALRAAHDRRGPECAVLDVDVDYFGIVFDVDAKPLCGEIERVEHGAPAAQKKRVRPPKTQRASERRLEAHSLFGNPGQHFLGLA